jgi:hypothetical protein
MPNIKPSFLRLARKILECTQRKPILLYGLPWLDDQNAVRMGWCRAAHSTLPGQGADVSPCAMTVARKVPCRTSKWLSTYLKAGYRLPSSLKCPLRALSP